MTDTLFVTENLSVRRWRDSDLAVLMSVYGDADAMKWVGDGQPISQGECEEWLVVTRKNYETRGYGMFAVEQRSTSLTIGFCGIVHPDGQEDAEVKYAYLRQFWGRGIASEALRGLITYGVNALAIGHLIATTDPQNHASHRVLTKAGFSRAELRRNEDGTDTLVFEYGSGVAAY
ncbi:GNAT family N-acetyltransferase [Marinobacter alexandrii]|uniref:GNAT family N-acetyltransferase n=1 Tax=Marinobacter alexandrii TaxID=2570351 RepID=UPI003298F04A